MKKDAKRTALIKTKELCKCGDVEGREGIDDFTGNTFLLQANATRGNHNNLFAVIKPKQRAERC